MFLFVVTLIGKEPSEGAEKGNLTLTTFHPPAQAFTFTLFFTLTFPSLSSTLPRG
jgi:hypothetical protein